MGKLILTRGVPASGKSTWAKAWVEEDPLNRVRVNRDNLRWTLSRVASGTSGRRRK
jgi:predicted kinase